MISRPWIHLIGIDPGLVDTGIVSWRINSHAKKCMLRYRVVNQGSATDVVDALNDMGLDFSSHSRSKKHVFVEGFRNRHNLAGSSRMIVLVKEIHQALPGSKVLDNSGIKKRIKKPLLHLLLADQLPTTNHGDLLSAARIALLGAFKDPELNTLIADIVRDELNQGAISGATWDIKIIH